ncbi:DUF5327 family protein [Salinicoccus halodurans]|uniref:YwdI family protein n=1 Tax=Salinicoccus halodurans TaxID=407035 RepID=A0A0F7HLX5_9STAP|nr:DUF5327 family protein [Salinicoccus halodurans]AKG75064.1 hypothetical protein AAT16_13235 [Salinicoccus halodurans]SFK65297.1 hypothetical protein SAMN05216235_0904 [Salinicoccus halodurans]
MKQQIIAELKQELHRMEVSSQPHEFEKHLYAMERLIGLLKQDTGSASGISVSGEKEKPSSGMSVQDREMLRMMGGRAGKQQDAPRQADQLPAETLDTDDGFGNGDSLFEF